MVSYHNSPYNLGVAKSVGAARVDAKNGCPHLKECPPSSYRIQPFHTFSYMSTGSLSNTRGFHVHLEVSRMYGLVKKVGMVSLKEWV